MKKPVALLLNDLHVSKDNISEFKANWEEALNLCETLEVSDMIIGGDMFTSRSSQTLPTLMAVREALIDSAAANLTVTISSGNHDKIIQEEEASYITLYSGMEYVNVVNSFKYLTFAGANFGLLIISYFPEKEVFEKVLHYAYQRLKRTYKDNVSKSNIILYIHEGIHGALGDFETENELPQSIFSEYRAVLCGHYHNRTKIRGTKIQYLGASRQHNFGEDVRKGYTILYSDGSTEFIQNEANLRYITFEIKASQLHTVKYAEDLLNYLNKPEKYRVKAKIYCSEVEAKTIDKENLYGLGFNKVEVIMESKMSRGPVSESITQKFDKNSIKQEYLQYCDENDFDSNLGIKYLED